MTMSAVTCPSDEASGIPDKSAVSSDPMRKVRVSGGVNIRCEWRLGKSRVTQLGERDGYKVRIPRHSAPPEAIMINTGGGIAGGDTILHNVSVGDSAELTITTQASERIYRSAHQAVTTMGVNLEVGQDASLNWLPQDTIIFDRSRLKRRISVSLTSTSRLVLAEATVFGRQAMGEILSNCLFHDSWRVRRDNKLVFAENVRLQDESLCHLSSPAIAADAKVALTVLYCAPDAEYQLVRVREILEACAFDCAASVWNNLLVVRALAPGPEPVRKIMASLAPPLTGRSLPRVWLT